MYGQISTRIYMRNEVSAIVLKRERKSVILFCRAAKRLSVKIKVCKFKLIHTWRWA